MSVEAWHGETERVRWFGKPGTMRHPSFSSGSPLAMNDLSRLSERLRNPQDAFPLLFAAQGPQRQTRVADAIDRMAQGLREGRIPNASLEEIKFTLGRAIEQAWDASVSTPYFYGGLWKQQSYAVQEVDNALRKPTSLHDLKVAIGRFAKLTVHLDVDAEPALRAMRTFLNEHAPLAEAGELLKGLAVKRGVKTETEREADARYVPPIANAQAAAMLHAALEQVTAKHYTQMERLFEQQFLSEVNAYAQYLQRPYEERHRDRYRRPFHQVEHLCVSEEGNSMVGTQVVMVLNTPAIVHRYAAREATLVREHFLTKNMRKLASLIDGKPGVRRIEVVGSDLSLKGLTGTLQVSFTDGSSFQAVNSVVQSTSTRGNRFYRYPLTFHKIRMPDGSTIARQSEEWMNTVFVPPKDGTPATTLDVDASTTVPTPRRRPSR